MTKPLQIIDVTKPPDGLAPLETENSSARNALCLRAIIDWAEERGGGILDFPDGNHLHTSDVTVQMDAEGFIRLA